MKKFLVYFVTLALLVIIGFNCYAGVIATGEKLQISGQYQFVQWGYYALCILVFYFLLFRPVMIVLFSPYYSVARYCDENDDNNGGIRRKARRLLKHGNLKDDEKKQLRECLKDHSVGSKAKLANRMYILYNTRMKSNIDALIVSCSRDTMVLTGTSQSHFVDFMIVLVNNFRMIKKIVVMCGFRPTFFRVCKIYIHVFAASLIADGIQKADVTSLITSSLKGTAKFLTDAAIDGAINAFFMLRIGVLTKNFIYASHPNKMEVSLLNNSVTEAVKLFPQVLASLVVSPIKGVASIIKKNNTVDDEDELMDTDELPKVTWSHKRKRQ